MSSVIPTSEKTSFLEQKTPQESQLASRVYRVAEVLQIPLYCLLNTIVGRLCTVLTPGKFGNYTQGWERARRALLIVAFIPVASVTVPCTLLAVVFNVIGDLCLGDQPSLLLPGKYTGEKKNTFATFNMSTLLPNMTLNDGGEYSDARLKEIAALLKEFHFVCGQEVDGDSARFFADELNAHFTEFHTYLGKSNAPLGLPSGLFFAAKEKVLSITLVPFTGPVQKAIKRQLVIFELETYCVATMHLDSGSGFEVTQMHISEITQAKEALRNLKKQVILCGDFNEDRYKTTPAYTLLTDDFVDCMAESPIGQKIETCTDKLVLERLGKKQSPSSESIDYITYPKKQTQLKIKFVGTEYGFYLSDHRLVKGEIVLHV